MAKGYLLRTDSLDLEEREFIGWRDIASAIGCDIVDKTKPLYPLNMEQMQAFPKIDIWCDDIGNYGGKNNLDNIDYNIRGNVVFLGHVMTPEGEDIADLDYKDACVMLDRLCVTEERRKAYMERRDKVNEINRLAVMTKDSIATGISFGVSDEQLDEFTQKLFDDIVKSDGALLEMLKSDVATDKYVKNGWVEPDLFVENRECVFSLPDEESHYPPGYVFFGIYKDEGNDSVLVKDLTVPVDAMKLAEYAKKEYGMDLKPNIIEFGSVHDDKFYLEKSEIREPLLYHDYNELARKPKDDCKEVSMLAVNFHNWDMYGPQGGAGLYVKDNDLEKELFSDYIDSSKDVLEILHQNIRFSADTKIMLRYLDGDYKEHSIVFAMKDLNTDKGKEEVSEFMHGVGKYSFTLKEEFKTIVTIAKDKYRNDIKVKTMDISMGEKEDVKTNIKVRK